MNKRISGVFVACLLIAVIVFAPALRAQSVATTHNLTLNNVVQSVDHRGRHIFVAAVRGDLAGVLTVALVVGPNGAVQGGEWALDASRIEFGPAGTDGDGDASETLVRIGFLKGTVTAGGAVLNDQGLATDLNGLRLNLTGATVKFAGAKTGSGSMGGANLHLQKSSNGFLTITF